MTRTTCGPGREETMKSKENRVDLKGVLAAVLTPMDEDLNPDHRAFAAHCHRLLEAGTAGALVLPPFYYKGVGDDGLFRFFAEVVERVGDDRLRLYLYHIPQMTGVDLGLPLISRLIDAYPGVVVGTKDSSGDRERIMTLCREFPDFSVLAGTETLLLETLRSGGEGCISATVNVTSRLARRVHDAHAAAKHDEADALQEHLTRLRASIEAYPMIPALKQLMARLTGDKQWRNLRPPLSSLDEKRTKDLLSNVPLAELV